MKSKFGIAMIALILGSILGFIFRVVLSPAIPEPTCLSVRHLMAPYRMCMSDQPSCKMQLDDYIDYHELRTVEIVLCDINTERGQWGHRKDKSNELN